MTDDAAPGNSSRMNVALLSPFHGGSHRAWAEGLARHSAHDVDLVTLEPRFWRWRMEGAALEIARQFEDRPRPDVVVATDMFDLASFLGLARRRLSDIPAILYMHENQLTYPVSTLLSDDTPGQVERVRQCGLINLKAMAAADVIAFNSDYHRTAWFEALPDFLRRFPEALAPEIVDDIQSRTTVLPVGIELADLPMPGGARPPLVLWNQRWEYDKNPDALMALLLELADRGVDFRVALCGERDGRVPEALEAGITTLGDRVVHQGFLPRADYVALLGQARVVLSTANHEFFGISVVEAACAGAAPLLPHRLSYPEILGEDFAAECLYADHDDALTRLATWLADPDPTRELARKVAASLRDRFGWPAAVAAYDDQASGAVSPV
ncbi:MAG: DUF3524 domain-containing protein [Acidobacteria bacterium]|nr:DUF3524 domain-containing protein [Acidobacteriota bacterium]